MIPSIKQWRRWSLPSKLTAVGVYLAVISLFVPIISFVSVKVYQYYSTDYDVVKVIPSGSVLNESMSGTYEERKGDISISYPQISNLFGNEFYDRLNREIEDNALSYLDEHLYEYNFKYNVGLQNPDFLSIKMMQYYYYYPAMNGNASILSLNVEPNKSRVIDFFDVFDARRDALSQLKNMIAEKVPDDCDIWEDPFYKNSYIPRFFVHESGVEFIFSEYEIAPGVCGSFAVDLAYESLQAYIKPNGPLGKMLPATGEWQSENHFIRGFTNAMQKLQNGS